MHTPVKIRTFFDSYHANESIKLKLDFACGLSSKIAKNFGSNLTVKFMHKCPGVGSVKSLAMAKI